MDLGQAKSSDFYGKIDEERISKFTDEDYDSEEERLILEGLECSYTPLQVACLLGYEELVAYLITKGKANPNLKGKKGYNAIWFAILGKQP